MEVDRHRHGKAADHFSDNALCLLGENAAVGVAQANDVRPPRTAARSASQAKSGSSFQPSKKCSASKITSRPWAFKNRQLSSIIRKFSSYDVSSTRSTWNFQHLPNTQQTGVWAASTAARLWSSSGAVFFLRVLPKETRRAFFKERPAARWKNSASFGLEPGLPASTY